MTTRQTSDNVKQLEQLAFDAGAAFILENMDVQIPAGMKPTPPEMEDGMEQWRQLALVRSLEKQVMNG